MSRRFASDQSMLGLPMGGEPDIESSGVVGQRGFVRVFRLVALDFASHHRMTDFSVSLSHLAP